MGSILNQRPKSFKSHEEAILWALRSHQLKNERSAKISIPSQLVKVGDVFKWRTDLKKSSPYWHGILY
jgi:protein phosphatase methylesterase 1